MDQEQGRLRLRPSHHRSLAKFSQFADRLVVSVPLVLARAGGAVLTGGLAIFVARTEGAEFSGRFYFQVSTITILSVITRLGVDPYLSSNVAARAREGDRATVHYLVEASMAASILVLGIGLILTLLHSFSPDLVEDLLGGTSIGYLLLAVTGLNLVWIAGGYFRAIGSASVSIFMETGLFSAWLFGMLIVSSILSIEVTSDTLAVSVALLTPVFCLGVAPLLIRARGYLLFRGGFSKALRGLLAYGAVTVTNGIVMLIPLQVLGWYGFDREAGIYNAALRVSMIVGAFGVVIKSAIVRQEANHSLVSDGRMDDVRKMFVFFAPWALFSVVIAWQSRLLSLLFGPGFTELESILLIMLLSQCLYVAGNLIETRAVLQRDMRLLNVNSICTIASAFVLAPSLVWFFGLQGAAWAFAGTIVASRMHLILMYLRSARPYRSLREAGRIAVDPT